MSCDDVKFNFYLDFNRSSISYPKEVLRFRVCKRILELGHIRSMRWVVFEKF